MLDYIWCLLYNCVNLMGVRRTFRAANRKFVIGGMLMFEYGEARKRVCEKLDGEGLKVFDGLMLQSIDETLEKVFRDIAIVKDEEVKIVLQRRRGGC